MKKLLFIILISPLLVFAQSKFLLKSNGEVREIDAKSSAKFESVRHSADILAGYTDTLRWHIPPTTNFGMFGQDWMVQWFEAPTDMIVKAAGYNCISVDDSSTELEVKLVKLNWSKDDILSAGEISLGYYEALGNGLGDATAFWDNPDRTGPWINNDENLLGEPFAEDIWSDGGIGAVSYPVADGNYQFVQMNQLGYEPVVTKGTIIGVAIKNRTQELNTGRVGFLSDNSIGIPGFKYYAGSSGWEVRDYTFDFVLEVEFPNEYCRIYLNPYSPPLPPLPGANDFEIYFSMNFYGYCFTVLDSLNATLYYAFDDNDFQSVSMSLTDSTILYATVPKPAEGAQLVRYYATVETVFGEFTSGVFTHTFFYPTHENLLLFNGFSTPTGYPQSYYFGVNDFVNYSTLEWEHDVWSFGAMVTELLNNYFNVIEITTHGPNDNNSSAIKEWLAADASRNYLLAGDEWFGVMTNWKDSTYQPGDFEYDVLGVKRIYNDINFTAEGDQQKATPVLPVENSLLGGELYNLFVSQNIDTMLYDPQYEVNQNNWLDGAEFLEDVEVDMLGYSLRDNKWYPIAGHRTLSNGNKIFLMLYDPLSLNSSPQYYWFGFTQAAPQVQALKWFGINITSVEDKKENIPAEFRLYQNYPNPFNPTTKIKYSIPALDNKNFKNRQLVRLIVYDILGRKVATLVDERKSPGNYEVDFDATNLSSGIYLYKLKAGNFVQVRKMTLLK